MLLNANLRLPKPHATPLRKYGGARIVYAVQLWTKDVAVSVSLPTILGFSVPATGAYVGSGLPTGVTINADSGTPQGTPTVETYGGTFTVTVTDTLGQTHVATVTYITAIAPIIDFPDSPFTWPIDVALSESAATNTGGTTGVVFSIQSGALPDGVTLDPTDGTPIGTPTEEGTGSAVVVATGPTGLTDTATIDWEVTPPPAEILPLFTSGGFWANEF